MSMDNKTISFIGLGKLGLPFALVMASKYKVFAYDVDNKKINDYKKGLINLYEKNVKNYYLKYKNRLSFSNNLNETILNSKITFIVVPTPSNKNGSFSLKFILQVCYRVGKIIKEKKTWHLIVITSTISPLSMERVIKPYLEKVTSKRIGKDFGLCYSPEFIALGNVIQNLKNPDFLLIGQSDKKSGDYLAKIRSSICDNNPPIFKMNFINAELTKLALNSYITIKISFANMLTQICEKIPGSNIDIITNALGNDSRIGKKYLKGGVSYGGPCFPRDNLALNSLIKSLNIRSQIPRIIHRFNEEYINSFARQIINRAKNKKVIGILGVTYKPNTNVVDESPGLKLGIRLINQGFIVNIYDPAIKYIDAKQIPKKFNIIYSLQKIIANSEIIIIMVPRKEFSMIKPKKNSLVFDCWRILKNKKFKNIDYIPLGIGL